MATQFITRDEYSGGNDQLFLRFSALLNTQFELVRTEMRANIANLAGAFNARFDKMKVILLRLELPASYDADIPGTYY